VIRDVNSFTLSLSINPDVSVRCSSSTPGSTHRPRSDGTLLIDAQADVLFIEDSPSVTRRQPSTRRLCHMEPT
jgi:hypothetical protein